MRASKYNLFFEHQGMMVLINTYSKQIVKMNKKRFDEISHILKRAEQIDNIKEHDLLYSKGYIVDDEFDEINLLKKECRDVTEAGILQLTMMMTYNCNFKCLYCFQHHIPNSFMDNNTIENVISFVKNKISSGGINTLYVEWFGGEPLILKEKMLRLHKEFKNIAQENRIPYISRITTNGYELDLNTFLELYRNHCFVYYISLDGTKETHDRQRPHKNGKGSYDVIIKNLLDIKNNVKYRNFRVEIRVNNSASTVEHLEKFISDFTDWFQNDKRFLLLLDEIQDWSERTKDYEDGLISNQELEKYGLIAKDRNVNMVNFTTESLVTRLCQAPKKNAYSIFYDGSILKCQMALESNEYKDINCIGNVNSDYFDQKKEALWVKSSFPSECEECIALPLCLGKKCVFLTNIKKVHCEDIASKLISQLKLEELSNLEYIEEI